MISLKLIDIFKDRSLDGMVHQCNCFHTMGGGIAKIVRERFPAAYAADKGTSFGSIKKLGTYSSALIEELENGYPVYPNGIRIFNCYSQFTYGGLKETDYDAVEKCFRGVCDYIISHDYTRGREPGSYTSYKLGIPYGYGCGLAGGDWQTVEGIILEVFSECPWIDVQICKLPG